MLESQPDEWSYGFEVSQVPLEKRRILSPYMVGVGLYTPAEASAYTGIPATQLRRWLFGYTAAGKIYDGLWQTELTDIDEQALSFHDLLEVRFVNAFRSHGVSLQAIRRASENAREIFNSAYPFTCKRFQTDGRSIFAEVQEETGDKSLVDLVKKQDVFREVVSPSLYHGIEYGADQTAQRWFPLRNSKKVVLDPAINFGKPVLEGVGVGVDAIIRAWRAEGENTRFIAKIFEIPVSSVEAALQFERRIAA